MEGVEGRLMVRVWIRHGIWVCLLGIVGLSSSVLAHEVSLPHFPTSWIGAEGRVDRPIVDTPVMLSPCAGTTHRHQSSMETTAELMRILALPFKPHRRAHFTAFVREKYLSRSDWDHFSTQLKFKSEARELFEVWQNHQQSDCGVTY